MKDERQRTKETHIDDAQTSFLAAQIPEVQFVIPDWCRMIQQNVTTDWSTVTDKPEIGVVTTGVQGSLLFTLPWRWNPGSKKYISRLFFAFIYGKLLTIFSKLY